MGDDRVYILDVYNRGIYPHDEYAKGIFHFIKVINEFTNI